MKNNNKFLLRKIWLFFSLVLLIKTGFAIFRNGPFIFPDEGCIIKKAAYFAETLNISSCDRWVGMPMGDVYPLYSILISPIYMFFHGLLAYKIALVFNAILISSLIFPLFKIFNEFIKNNKFSLIASILLVFIPQFAAYEKTLMTESLYGVLLIWFLFFYIKSFASGKLLNISKLMSILIGILMSLTRPFGFILLLAVALNEVIISKNKKKCFIIFIPVSLLMGSIAIFFFSKGIFSALYNNIISLSDFENWKYLMKAFFDQVNSFTFATFVIPLILFFKFFLKKNFIKFIKIKFFLLSYIILNFLVSFQHIYGYYLNLNYSPNLVVRYIQSSAILILIFSFVFLYKYKSIKLNIQNKIFILFLIVSMLFFDNGKFGLALNLELLPFLNTIADRIEKDLMPSISLFKYLVFPFFLILLLLLRLNLRKIIIYTGIIGIFLYALTLYSVIQNFSNYPRVAVDILNKLDKSKIAVIIVNGNSYLLGEYWRIITLTEHEARPLLVSGDGYVTIKKDMFKQVNTFNQADYIISSATSDLPLYGTSKGLNVYINKK